ncbi:monovalent cation/H+ antiporter complex subunit F [Spirochaeta isovalerica]|uniref:Multicomponent Na+:H+ antiporter subunit F n=1 Tax=Spirochaeta isovalerica TaxID=150 RepID=A0A841RFS9_9SPIO|nr:monovalent cation/H+ antiporter complex subunit F [Spirochaeta isovalerica]MBB6481418.1 multicomponent Na+:H+ antiporter subunit F [Spirochaeta isovalerica]
MREFLLTGMQWFIIACILVCIIRILTSRTTSGKLVGLNVLSGVVLAFLVLRGVSEGRALYLDVALVYDIFGFLGFLGIARFLKDKIQGESQE